MGRRLTFFNHTELLYVNKWLFGPGQDSLRQELNHCHKILEAIAAVSRGDKTILVFFQEYAKK
jgi:hypothetical protein